MVKMKPFLIHLVERHVLERLAPLQNNPPTESLSGQVVISVGRCPLTSCYFEPCHNTQHFYVTDLLTLLNMVEPFK